MTTHSFDRLADIEAALADPRLIPVPPATTGPVGGMAWLRASVARFASGAVHAERRRVVEAELAGLDPAMLRALAAAWRPDVDDRRRVVGALAEALDIEEPAAVAERIPVVADNYFGDTDSIAEADDAVKWLLGRLGPTVEQTDEAGLELAANRTGLLVQACDATATLIANARKALGTDKAAPSIAAVLADTLRHDPPVRVMRRVAAQPTHVGQSAIAEGDALLLDIAAAAADPQTVEPLTFGAPPRVCPGRDHALALAAGVLAPDVAAPITHLVAHALALAETWTAWDGRPLPVDDRLYTPHKAVRRTADHLLDHLAELEARLVGAPPWPDRWHASAATTPADLAPFTVEDLDEARSRLTRLEQIWRARLSSLTPDQLDRSPGPGWSLRELVLHLAGSVYYADAVGDLRQAKREP